MKTIYFTAGGNLGRDRYQQILLREEEHISYCEHEGQKKHSKNSKNRYIRIELPLRSFSQITFSIITVAKYFTIYD